MNLFLGEYDHVLDDRGRVTLARKIRNELIGSEVVLSRGFDLYIAGYDKKNWETESVKQLETPITDKKGRELRR